MMEPAYVEEAARAPTLEQDPAQGISHRAKIEILIAILLALFLGALDQTIVGVALPDDRRRPRWQQRALHVGRHDLPARATITGVFYGKLSDIYGRRLMLLIGITIFLIGSALSGLLEHGEPHPLPRHPGRRRRRDLPGLARGHRRPLHARRARPLHGPLRRGVRRRVDPRAAAGRLADRPASAGTGSSTSTCPIGVVSLYIIYRYLPSIHGEHATSEARLPGRRRLHDRHDHCCWSA